MITMRVLLDNDPCPISPANIGEALLAASDIAEGQGRLVVEILVDGRPLTDDDLQEEECLSASAEEVQLKTTTATLLLSETFANAAQAIQDANTVHEQAADLIRSGKSLEGMHALSTALSIWGEIHEAVVKGLALAGEDPDTLKVGEVRLTQASSSLQEILADLKSGIALQDNSSICDCLLYEFPPVSSQWIALLEGLSKRYDSTSTEGNDSEP